MQQLQKESDVDMSTHISHHSITISPTLLLGANNTLASSPQVGLSVEQRMHFALNAVINKGETPTCAARKWQLKRTAILCNLLRERKRLRSSLTDAAANHITSRKLFQSKFTSNQLLSAHQEESLANYLKQCYEMQWQHTSTDGDQHHLPKATTKPPPLLSEEVARSFTHNFVHMHKLKYPSSWDAKQQAATDWFNGFVDRNPEVIEYVQTSNRERKQRKRGVSGPLIKLESSEFDHDGEEMEGTSECQEMTSGEEKEAIDIESKNIGCWQPVKVPEGTSYGQDLFQAKGSSPPQSTEFGIKLEPVDEAGIESLEDVKQTLIHSNSANLALSEETSHSTKELEFDLPTESIAESVKRRTMRKARILTEHLYASGMPMEAERVSVVKPRNQMLITKKFAGSAPNPIKIQKVQACYQQPQQQHKEGKTLVQEPIHQRQTGPRDELKECIEEMHSDMSYLLQSMLMEMSENNRLLRCLISTNENKQ